ncbi:sorbosone dehydrogenase family protein [Candidatus Gottesmanbacteria bacterium]|nr:sorbosone dehydrogenase family protein [Candidatus Gottesmanbacteria bacterium]
MKKVILLFVIAALGFFVYNNFRGAKPAIMPAVIPAKNLTDFPLTLPDGFSISIFAQGLGNPRVLAWDPNGTLLASVPSQGKVVALTDPQVTVASGLNRPHGIAFLGSTLYIAETNQVAMYDYDLQAKRASNKKKIIDLPTGGNHITRTIGFDRDRKLYISVGSSCNVCVDGEHRAKILVANADGSDLKIYASGLRNSVFFTWHSKTHELWATEMGRDLIGDNIPPDEINIIKEGNFYGWPYCYGKNTEDKTFTPSKTCRGAQPSYIDLQAHSAPLGLAFIPSNWPAEYRDDLLIAYHGSWDRTEPTGYKIVRAKLDAQGNFEGIEDFITGWLTSDGALGRPADLLFAPDGSLYISDDKAGVIYRVTYNRP